MVSVRVRVSCRSGVSATSVKDVIDSLRFEHRCINLLHPGHLATQKLLSQLGFGVTCLDLCPPVLAGTSGGEIPPYLAIVGDSLCSLHATPMPRRSSANVIRQDIAAQILEVCTSPPPGLGLGY